tara:strand:- start:286 stop:2037 length:1752 start_codon:yes stop_codon:yes gene_type:complete
MARRRELEKYRKWIFPALIYWGVSAIVLLSSYHALSQEADGTNCASGVIGLCTPGTFESSVSTTVETIQSDETGTTTTDTTTTDTTTTTVTNPETGDLLTDSKVQEMGRNQKFGGDMTNDWGGQGSAKIRNGATCGDLGTDRCAELTSAGSFTSTLGQGGIGSTYKQIINMTHSSIDPSIDRGGQVPWSIRVEKRDASDSIHFRIAKSDGTTAVLLGSETLSAAGADVITNTLFQGTFNFSGAITNKLTIEVSGRDINLGIGPLFDDVTVNVIYNVVNTIVTQTITTIEQFIALEVEKGTFDQEKIDVATDIFENNIVVETNIGLSIEPIVDESSTESSYESVVVEIDTEMGLPEIQVPTIEVSVPEPQSVEVQVETQNVETEMQMEMNNDINNEVAPSGGVASEQDSPEEGGGNVSDDGQEAEAEPTVAEGPETEEEPQSKPSSVEEKKEEPKTVEAKPETTKKAEPKEQPKKVAEKKTEKPKTKAEKKQDAKEKAASKIVKKMGDKGRYDDSNQLKTLVVMQVLGNTKNFFSNQAQLQDTPGFFDNKTIPDTTISDNNYSAYIMFGGSDAAHNALTESQYR